MDRIIYAAIPPPKNWSKEKTQEWTGHLIEELEKEKINTINLPEVISEKRQGKRALPFLEKQDNLAFWRLVKKENPKLTTLLNKITVQLPEKQLLNWIERGINEQIAGLILVGGEKSEIQYPCLSVNNAARRIKKKFPELALGGITIFTRPREADRMIEKIAHGIEFFVSQIIFETANMKCVLLNLAKKCKENHLPMPRIYLSLAAAEKKNEVEFMRWLGVEFPTAVHSYILEEEECSPKMFEVLDSVLEEIFTFAEHTGFDLGFNVEQTFYNNMNCSLNLVRKVKKGIETCQ